MSVFKRFSILSQISAREETSNEEKHVWKVRQSTIIDDKKVRFSELQKPYSLFRHYNSLASQESFSINEENIPDDEQPFPLISEPNDVEILVNIKKNADMKEAAINTDKAEKTKEEIVGVKIHVDDEQEAKEELLEKEQFGKENKQDDISDDIIRDSGEPLEEQCLEFDFTPIPGIDDNEFISKKCSNFWKFVEEHPELKSLKAEPFMGYSRVFGPDLSTSSYSPGKSFTRKSDLKNESKLSSKDGMALDWLSLGVMNHSLAAKNETLPCDCEPISRIYSEYVESDGKEAWITGKKYEHEDLKNAGPRETPSLRKKSHKTHPEENLALLMTEMRTFDLKHPDSMKQQKFSYYMAPTVGHKGHILSPLNEDKYCEKRLN